VGVDRSVSALVFEESGRRKVTNYATRGLLVLVDFFSLGVVSHFLDRLCFFGSFCFSFLFFFFFFFSFSLFFFVFFFFIFFSFFFFFFFFF